MGGEGRNILQPPRFSLAFGLRNSMQWPLPQCGWCAPHGLPIPDSLCQWGDWSVWQLHTEHHSCSLSTFKASERT